MESIEPVELDFSVPKEWVRKFGQQIKEKWKAETHYYNTTLSFKSSVADGNVRLVVIDDGLCITFTDIITKKLAVTFHKNLENEHSYLYYFDRALNKRIHISEETEVPMGLTEKYSFLAMSSNTYTSTKHFAPASVTNVLVQVSRNYLKKIISLDDWPISMELAKKYMGFDPIIVYGACTQRILSIIEDMYHEQLPEYAERVYLKGSVIQLISQVLLGEVEKQKGIEVGTKNLADIRNIIELSHELQKQFDEPLPSIEKLSADLHMSATKFKTLFKKIFDASYYNYFQTLRLAKARELLLTKNFSVGEVADQIGFINTGQFSRAFKKAYDVLPNEIMRTDKEDLENIVFAELNNLSFQVHK